MTTWIIRLGAATTDAADGFRRQTGYTGSIREATDEARRLGATEGVPAFVIDPFRIDEAPEVGVGMEAR